MKHQQPDSSLNDTLRIEQSIALVKRLRAAKLALSKANEIDVTDNENITRWCKEFAVTPFQLFRAIETVGTNAAVVRRQLNVKNVAAWRVGGA